jgi:exopolysaccharide biosynthesis protein
MKKRLLIGSFLIVLAIIAIVMYIYKPHRNIQKETATHQIEAKTLYESFTSDEQTANQKFLDQVIEIK